MAKETRMAAILWSKSFTVYDGRNLLEYNMNLFVCCWLFSWRYNPLWLYFPQPGSGL
jgi:hypothetical protein